MKGLSKSMSLVASIFLFVSVFIVWQISWFIIRSFTLPTLVYYALDLAIPAINLLLFTLFVKLSKSTFRDNGYRKPNTLTLSKCFVLTTFFILFYIIFYIISGVLGAGLQFMVPVSPFRLLYRTVSAILYSLAAVSVFQGYIFRNLSRNYGFFSSLYASSLMFSLHRIPVLDLPSLNLGEVIFTNILIPLAASLFLGFFFYKIGWSLLGPAIFYAGVWFFLNPQPLVSPLGVADWMALTFEISTYAILILIVESVIAEPRYRRKRYGLES